VKHTSAALLGLLVLIGLLFSLTPPGLPAAHAQGGVPVVVIATGLDHPKGIAFAPNGDLFVAESGHSNGTCPPPTQTKAQTSAGATGAVAQITTGGTVRTVLSGLASSCTEGDYIGPSGVAFAGRSLYVLQGYCPHQWPAPTMPCTTSNPLLRLTANGTTESVAQFSSANNGQTPNMPEEDPYAITPGPDGYFYVADGGNNSVWKLRPGSGTLTTLPRMLVQFPKNPVPTGLAFGKDGALYVALFSAAPFLPGTGKIERVTANGQYTDAVTGLTTPIAVAFSPAGTMYVLQYGRFALKPFPHFTPMTGAVVRVSASGLATPVITGLTFPTAMVFGPNGALYITNNGTSPAPAATGQVVVAALS
jgi:glucose/arabinose dehydrogenase